MNIEAKIQKVYTQKVLQEFYKNKILEEVSYFQTTYYKNIHYKYNLETLYKKSKIYYKIKSFSKHEIINYNKP